MYYYSPFNKGEIKPIFTSIHRMDNVFRFESSIILFKTPMINANNVNDDKCIRTMLFELESAENLTLKDEQLFNSITIDSLKIDDYIYLKLNYMYIKPFNDLKWKYLGTFLIPRIVINLPISNNDVKEVVNQILCCDEPHMLLRMLYFKNELDNKGLILETVKILYDIISDFSLIFNDGYTNMKDYYSSMRFLRSEYKVAEKEEDDIY